MATKVDLASVDWYSVLPRLGIDHQYLKSRKKKGPCPVCLANTGDAGNTRFMFINKTGKGDWYCHHGTGHGGDAVSMLMEINGWDFITTIKEITQSEGLGKNIEYQSSLKKEREDDQKKLEKDIAKLNKVWLEAKPIVTGDPVWKYLNNRVPGLIYIPDSSVCRFHPSLEYWDVVKDASGKESFKLLGKFPAMVSLVSKENRAVSIHRTFITSDGYKANVPDYKKSMSGKESMSGSSIKLTKLVGDELGVSEGIEKSLAISTAYKNKFPIWSLVSGDILKKFIPPPQVKKLHIFHDFDEKGISCSKELEERSKASGIEVVMHTTGSKDKDFDDVWKEIYAKNQKIKVA